MQVITPDTEVFKMAVGHHAQITESGLIGTQLKDDFVEQTKKDFLINDTDVVFSHVAFCPPIDERNSF